MDDTALRDPLPLVLLVLTVTTGLIDAVSVLGLGRVFIANMTGNVAFLGFAIGGAPGFSVPRCLTAVGGFLLGAAIGARLCKTLAKVPRRRWLMIIGCLEAALLLAAALFAIGYDLDKLVPVTQLYGLILTTSLAMGVRNATTRQLAVPDLTTTVLAQTLTGLAADSFLAGKDNPRWTRRAAAVVCMFLGATLGAALIYAIGLAVPLALAGVLVLAAMFAYALHPASMAAGRQAR
ncbi:YoaK family protein [Massilia horti]|nr:YoaK family protein [Massilia horti]